MLGYGVFLDIKNMEYKNVDDDKKDVGADAGGGGGEEDAVGEPSISFPADESVAGLVFSTLLSRRPAAGKNLKALRDALMKEGAADDVVGGGKGGGLKIWQLKDLGMQAVASIMEQMSSSSQVVRLEEIAHSFPLHAPALSAKKVPALTTEQVTNWYASGMPQMLPHGSLIVNGRRIELGGATFNVYDLLSILREEYSNVARLHNLKVPAAMREGIKAASTNLLSLNADGSAKDAGGMGMMGGSMGSVVRIDVSKGGKYIVCFINNLEKDAIYKRWPKSLKQLTMPTWSLHTVARNIYTVIVVVDMYSLEGVSLVLQLHNMIQQQYPVRFGIVLACFDDDTYTSSSTSTSFSTSTSVEAHTHTQRLSDDARSVRNDVCRLFALAKEKHGMDAAFAFLVALATTVLEGVQSEATMQQQQQQQQQAHQSG